MNAVVTNSTVDGVLAAFFALLIIVVILDATRICIKAIRSREPLPNTEVPKRRSPRCDAPDGLFDPQAGAGRVTVREVFTRRALVPA